MSGDLVVWPAEPLNRHMATDRYLTRGGRPRPAIPAEPACGNVLGSGDDGASPTKSSRADRLTL